MDVGAIVAANFVTDIALPESAVACVLGQPDCWRHALHIDLHIDLPAQFRGFLPGVGSVRAGRAGSSLQVDGPCSHARFEGH